LEKTATPDDKKKYLERMFDLAHTDGKIVGIASMKGEEK